jgi:exopolysaccharide biosynthesis polyprenyl glycosylphosphotransferase
MIKMWRQRMKFVLSDYCLLNISWLLFTVIRYSAIPVYYTATYTFTRHILSQPVLTGQILFPIGIVCLYWLSGYYNTPYFKSRLEDIANTAYVSMISSLLIFFAVLVNDNIPERWQNYEMILYLWLLLTVPIYISRSIISNAARRNVRKGKIVFNTLIVGSQQKALALLPRLERYRFTNGMNVVGIVETDPHHLPKNNADIPTYSFSQIDDVVRDNDIIRIIVVSHSTNIKKSGELINQLFRFDCSIYVTPDLYNLIVARPRIANIVGEPLIDISNASTPHSTRNCKRLADVVISFLALIILIPAFLVIALAVKREKSGSVIYSQERIGYHKHPFKIYKFRTMRADAEADGPSLSSDKDSRVTRVGRFLRKYRLDELPQFFNVLRGDMSLVGPRPEREYYIRQIVAKAPYYNLVHQVRPGITSWGMVKYGYATTVDQMIERLQYDLLYLDNISLQVDLKILFHTVNTVLTGKGL